MTFSVGAETKKYDIIIESGAINNAGRLFDLDRRVLILTDDGVPEEYSKIVAGQCRKPVVFTVKAGEKSKSISVWENALSLMLENGFDRYDCVVAVGGGVCGDLAGFVASAYMRGVDFYNIPTTVLSQVDSSIGGKTAVNFGKVKNIIGAFYPPCGVIIDTSLLSTLLWRQIANGLAESVKMALTFDSELFELIEKEDINKIIPEVIERSLLIKKRVVEEDEKESGVRRVLNFGHTIGHGIESLGSGLYHGECVALGMLPMCSDEVRKRLVEVLKKLGLPYRCDTIDPEKIAEAVAHDKKSHGDRITAVLVDKVGEYRLESVPMPWLKERIDMLVKGNLI